MAFEKGRWVLQKARGHGNSAFLWSEWMSVLQGQRAVRVDGLLTVLGNYSPLPWSTAEAPSDLGDGRTNCQTFNNLKQKNLRNLPGSQEQGRAESWKQRCTSFVLGVLRMLLQCLSAAGAFPQHSAEATKWHRKPPPQLTQLPASGWSRHWKQMKQLASQNISHHHSHSLILWRP